LTVYDVLNVTSAPWAVPAVFVAENLKWYSVFGVRAVSFADTATGLVPDPGSDLHGAFDPYLVLVPYSNSHSVTFCPSGLTLAFRVAEVKRKQGLPVTVTLTFQSSRGGSPVSHTQSITVKLKSKKK